MSPRTLRALLEDSSGQGLTEYAVILAVVVVAAVAVLGLFGQSVVTSLTGTLSKLSATLP